MIQNRLNILLAERGLKANRVSLETGIARSTLSSLVNNDSKMIQLDTINTLCQYLQITPNDFFDFLPFDLEYSLYFEPNWGILNDDDYDYDLLKAIRLTSFSSDFFIKKISNNPLSGKHEQTFELELQLLETEDLPANELIKRKNNMVTLNFKIVPRSEHDFWYLWNNQLTPSFRTLMTAKLHQQFAPIIKSSIDKLATAHNIHIEWKRILFDFDFVTSDSSTPHDSLGSPSLVIETENLPF